MRLSTVALFGLLATAAQFAKADDLQDEIDQAQKKFCNGKCHDHLLSTCIFIHLWQVLACQLPPKDKNLVMPPRLLSLSVCADTNHYGIS